jgi:hypothetical protein
MRYVLLIHVDEAVYPKMSEAQMGEMLAAYGKLTQELEAAGVLRDAARLRPVTTATTVRVRNEKTLTTDGPFAETKEQLGGFYLIEVKDLDEALAWAAKVPSARQGSIEVRPVWERGEA